MRINKNWARKAIKKYPFLHRFISWNDGLDITKQEEVEKDTRNYFLGDAPVTKEVLQPDGQWLDYFGENERQANEGRFESMSCTVFAFLNIIEALAKRQFGEVWNKSDRFTAKMSGVTTSGNSMDNVLESTRKLHGLLEQAEWPNLIDNITWYEFFKTIPQSLQEKAKHFLDTYEIYYERLPDARISTIKEALKFSPVYCGGYAWYLSNGVYKSFGNPNHAFVIQGYDGNNLIVKDSYEPFDKKLSTDYRIYYPKVIILKKKSNQPNLNSMTNVKILKDKNSAQVGFYLPQINEEAMISVAKNFDIELPLTDGKLNWDELKIDGEFELK